MSFFSSPAFGQIAGGVIGGLFGNKAAKYQRGNDAAAIAAQMAPFNLVSPYLSDLYSDSKDALNKALGIGAYTGDTYAGMNPLADEGYSAIAGLGRKNFTTGSNLMDAAGGFGQNQADIYNRASGRTLDDAVNYASSSPQAQSLIEAAMRDSTRRLEEQTLPGIDRSASATGNTRSSRAGVAEALAQRAYDDRRSDVAAGVGRDLTNQYLRSETQDINNMMNANRGLKDIFGFGVDLGRTGANDMVSAGGAYQLDEQGRLDAERDAFERQRDFAMGQYGAFGNLLGGMPNVGQVRPSTANPYTAALSGGMMGAGFGGEMFRGFGGNSYGSGRQPYGGYYNNPYAINPIFEPAGF